ncbi:hypothetical protein Y032_0116g534 [Ancylostoma ceylanicum]|uniref:Uncharacterized protein n=1 Tax=Ancylostoma ceylanicum TaxID=53326 RepID=A0A016TC69_9BILA|nr:hypothetical protein Y032_0116g534 [Ancylostoma ceylanicum]
MSLQEPMKARRCSYTDRCHESRTRNYIHGSMNARIVECGDSSASSKSSARIRHRDAARPPTIRPAHNVQTREVEQAFKSSPINYYVIYVY